MPFIYLGQSRCFNASRGDHPEHSSQLLQGRSSSVGAQLSVHLVQHEVGLQNQNKYDRHYHSLLIQRIYLGQSHVTLVLYNI